MKSIIFGFTLVGAAAAQIAVNGLYTMPTSPSVPTATPGAVGSPTNPAPPQVTAAPTSLPPFYQQMPYSSYMNGGYQSLDCGYGYHKSNGHCVPYSWVIILVLPYLKPLPIQAFPVHIPERVLRNYDHQQHVCSLLNLLSFFSDDLDHHSNNGGYCNGQTVTMYNTIYQTVVSMTLLGAWQRYHVPQQTATQTVPYTVTVKETQTVEMTQTQQVTQTQIYTSVEVVPTTRVWVSTEIIDNTKTVDHTLTATETMVQTNVYTQTDVQTATATETLKQTQTDFVTMTEMQTVVLPTTYTKVWVSTQVIDNVCTFLLHRVTQWRLT